MRMCYDRITKNGKFDFRNLELHEAAAAMTYVKRRFPLTINEPIKIDNCFEEIGI